MFGGFGGEILYRPFKKKYAVGFSACIKLNKEILIKDFLLEIMKLLQDI